MRISLLCSVASLFLASTAAFAQGEGEFPATLAGHAVLPALSFIEAPADAPDDLKTSGKYTTGRRVDAIGSVMGKSFERPTGVSLPFKGQPLQGHSGIKVMPDGSFWVITDNGMGSRYNSPDSMLYLNRHKIDWATGKVERQETVFLHDPDKKVPFRIVHEDTAKPLSHRRRLRHRRLSDHRRHLLDRRRVRPLHPEDRPQRQGAGGVRDRG